MKTRNRNIHTIPRTGGLACDPKNKEEVAPCNTQPCSVPKCVDGEWGPWGNWETCTETCEGGLTWRSRVIAKTANACGTPATGVDREHKACNTDKSCHGDVDCEFGEWSPWSDCTMTCFGTRGRTRGIATAGGGLKGRPCIGDLKQTAPCNPGFSDADDMSTLTTAQINQAAPQACQVSQKIPVDCLFSDWTKFGECTAPCGGGQQVRTRFIEAEGSYGGAVCKGPLEETLACNTEECEGPAPIDCEWVDWHAWGACDRCDGQWKRYRSIQKVNKNRGVRCLPGDSEETRKGDCERCTTPQMFCTFGEWKEWGDCTVSCGIGKRSRRRFLLKSSQKAKGLSLPDVAEKYELLQRSSQNMENTHVKELGLAFLLGAVSLGVLPLIGRACQGATTRRNAVSLERGHTELASAEASELGSAAE